MTTKTTAWEAVRDESLAAMDATECAEHEAAAKARLGLADLVCNARTGA